MAERSFGLEDQLLFARFSGDTNPLHVDPSWAATVFPGEPVVHGMHALLWGLESTWPGGPISTVAATFIKPIVVNDHVLASINGDELNITFRDQPMVVARVNAGKTWQAEDFDTHYAADSEWLHRAGRITPQADDRLMERLFPRLAAACGNAGLRGMAALSRLVGMECPGMNGMFADFAVAIRSTDSDLTYRVTIFDRRFSRITMTVDGCLTGTVSAFVAGVPPAPPADAELRAVVRPDEFKSQCPLIIGGSAGLGAISSLLLAAGGAHPTITYYASHSAAEQIAARITALGATCDVLQFDVREPKQGLAALQARGWNGGQVYFFATPRIFRRRVGLYQAKDLHEFMQTYVDGFYELVRELMQDRGTLPLTILYPSTAAIGHGSADLFEYTLAKEAGERLCQHLQKKYRTLSINVERLPRISTRQTQSFIKATALLPHEVMLPAIRRLQCSQRDK
jgi:hypothetical protein